MREERPDRVNERYASRGERIDDQEKNQLQLTIEVMNCEGGWERNLKFKHFKQKSFRSAPT